MKTWRLLLFTSLPRLALLSLAAKKRFWKKEAKKTARNLSTWRPDLSFSLFPTLAKRLDGLSRSPRKRNQAAAGPGGAAIPRVHPRADESIV